MKLNKFVLSVVAALLAAVPAIAEKVEVKKVDFARVKSVTHNPESRYYYPKLMEKFLNNAPTDMDIEDYRNFYFGYVFQEDYNPYRKSVYSEKVENLYYQKSRERNDCDSIQKYAELSVYDNLFDLDQLEYYCIALKDKKKHTLYQIREKKLDMLIRAIMTSGRGTKDEPWVVICPAHEYYIINSLGYQAIGYEALDGGIDYIKVEPKEGSKVEGFYFDVSQMLAEAKRKGFDD